MKPAPTCCPSCGAKTVEYKHGLNLLLAQALVSAFYGSTSAFRNQQLIFTKPFKVADLGLSHSQQANFQKLAYWEFVSKVADGWILNPRGADFVLGRAPAPRFAWTYRGKFKRYDGDDILIYEVIEGYQVRAEYAAAAEAHAQDEQAGQRTLI